MLPPRQDSVKCRLLQLRSHWALEARTKADVVRRAGKIGVSVATLYNWLRAYEESDVLSSLLRRGRADKGKTRLASEVERLIETHLEKRYLSGQRLSKRKFATEVQDACRASGQDRKNS